MIASAPAWAVWLALGLWAVAIAVGVVAFVMARRLWGQFKPMVEPYLLMFVQPSQAAAGTDGIDKPIGSSPAAPYLCELHGVYVTEGRCPDCIA